MRLEDKKRLILEHMAEVPNEWYTPTELGVDVFGRESWRASSYTSHICQSLVLEGKLERSSRGWYRLVNKEAGRHY